jgi:hypothetical protein
MQKMAKEIEMRIKAEYLAREAVQGRPFAQSSGSTAGQIMERGVPTAGDKWAAKIGGPGGSTAEQAYENYRMRKGLAPGESLLRSGIAMPPGADVEALAKQSAMREAAAMRPTFGQQVRQVAGKVPSALSSVSKFLGPNRVLGPLSGAYSAYEMGQAADDFSKGQYIDAILRGIPAAGGAMMATGVPALQLPGMALGVSPAIGNALSPSLANLMEYLAPFEKPTEQNNKPTDLSAFRGRRIVR